MLRLLVEFPSRSGREEDTEGTDGCLLHFNTGGKSATTGNSSWGGREIVDNRGEREGKREVGKRGKRESEAVRAQ